MSKLTVITDRALEIVGHAGEVVKSAGSNLRQAAPQAGQYLKTGAAIGAVKTGGRAAGRFARRNPAITAAAAVAGVSLLGYALYRRHKQKQALLDDQSDYLEHESNVSPIDREVR